MILVTSRVPLQTIAFIGKKLPMSDEILPDMWSETSDDGTDQIL